ncbi:hypothetical protein [Lutimonas zeaxanthinifaciens]|uniref:hypothetical protein n=1 Tax=Lutimonas zeaxanthinifaciens TaxID=3060215 RepID=UPI00265CA1E3|nr:hypothetical protein [Lutimonas sp. YSD2104]WKK64784.1 hypothetical protein QZH61_09325 [Lutimonas sp. YSD2104]
MKVDIKQKLKEEKMLRELSKDHRSIFETKLKKELHTERKGSYKFLLIAASVAILFSIGLMTSINQESSVDQVQAPQSAKVSLEEFSPELKKIENYYLTAINFELANLEITDGNKLILEEYFRKMNSLTNEYKLQSERLEIDKIDEELINGLIDNLQMRLQLMIELKNELKKLKSKENENYAI